MTPCNSRLRATQADDLPFVISAEQHIDNAPYVDQWSQSQHEAAIDSPDYGHFIVEPITRLKESISSTVGYVIVSGVQDPNQVLLLKRIVIVEKGKGYGRGALQQVKAFAFEQLGFHRLWLDVVASNERAQALYRSEGFVIEGRLREAYKTNHGYEDMLILSLLSTEAALRPTEVGLRSAEARKK